MKQEFIFSDLGSLCEPREAISHNRHKDKWCSYSYSTADFKGSMLVSPMDSKPCDVSLNPGLKGWHKIYVGLYAPAYYTAEIELKLSDDTAFTRLSTCAPRTFARHIVEDVFWKCAFMDGESIVIGKHLSECCERHAIIAWIKLVPMTDEEINTYVNEKGRTDTKRIYATNDMHGMLCCYDMSREHAWKSVVHEYADSDTEWLAIENISHNNGKITDCSPEEFSFFRSADKAFYNSFKSCFSRDVLRDLVSYGQKMGLKMCVSMRVCEWGMDFPFDRIHFEQQFAKDNPHLRCIDRDGDITEYMSYMYPEVQDYIINEFINMASTGCDAVQLLLSRGWPFILFEKTYTDLFYKRYGEDARLLPLDDKRIVELKCEIMTNFIRKLRRALDDAGYQKTELHAKVLFSVYDNRLVGLDLDAWAREGLVQRIVSDERRIREILPESVMHDGKIDLEKYSQYANSSLEEPILYEYDSIFKPMADSKGELKGPKSNTERIQELMQLEVNYGMTVYIEIMPRHMNPDKIAEKAREIYDTGCSHIGLWDTYSRVPRRAEWNMWSKIGHKDELDSMLTLQKDLCRLVRITEIDGKNVRAYKSTWGG